MSNSYTYLADIPGEMEDIPPDSIVSRTLYQDQGVKTILFGFAPGQQLSEHTAAVPALLYFLEGRASLTLGEDAREAEPGTWVHMPPHLPHSIRAENRVIMLLVLLEQEA